MTPPSLGIITSNLWIAAPVGALCTAAMIVLLVGAFWPKSSRAVVPALSVLGVIATGLVTVWAQSMVTGPVGMQSLDGFTVVFDLIVLAATAVAVLIASPYLNREGLDRGEYYALMLFSASGAMLMAASDNLIMIFLGLELLSIPLYVLAGFARTAEDSEEAGLKYFLLGSFASAFLVFGSALTYASTGSTSIAAIASGLGHLASGPAALLTIGLGLVVVGLAFKVALVPFHMWTPDVYQGAPTSATAFMAVVAKAGGFAALIRLTAIGLQNHLVNWDGLLWGIAAATMIWGNLIAIAQQNIKRLLAYSSIAHAGYILMGILAGTVAGFSAVLFYIASYAAMVLGAFGLVILLSGPGDQFENINDYRGLARRSPVLGLLMAVFMFSLAGLPPFSGFFAKLFIFLAAIRAGYTGLAVIAVMTSVMGVFYYLRVIVVMWMEEARSPEAGQAVMNVSRLEKAVCAGLAVVVLALGIFASPVVHWTDAGAAQALQGQDSNTAARVGKTPLTDYAREPRAGDGSASFLKIDR